MRIAAQIFRRHKVRAERVFVRVVEQPSEIVLGNAPLPPENGRLALQRAVDVAKARRVVRAVYPVVQRSQQGVGRMFRNGARGSLRVVLGRVIVGVNGYLIALQLLDRAAKKPETP